MPLADLSVLIIADDPLARAGIATLLGEQAGYTIVGQIAGDQTALTAIATYEPDIAVWDLGGEPRPSLDLLTDVRDAGVPVLALVPTESQAAGALRAGVRGLLRRDVTRERLLAALNAIRLGFVVLDPALGVARARVPAREGILRTEDLTPREFEVLQLLAEGLSNKTIADRLAISEHTAKFHVTAILGKLDAQTRTEAVARAARLGLILL